MIKIKLVLDGKLEVLGVYDSSSNVSLINPKLLKSNKSDNTHFNGHNLKTINDVKQSKGIGTLNAEVLNVAKKINVFVIVKENFDYDFLIGLDYIKNFNFFQDENLEISERTPMGNTFL